MIKLETFKKYFSNQQFIDSLPEDNKCECGADLFINEALTRIECQNPNCFENAVQRMVSMVSDLGIRNMGESRCRDFLNYFDTLNAYAIFAYDPNTDGVFGNSEKVAYDLYEQVSALPARTLGEYVKVGNYPGLQDSALSLFKGYCSLETFYADFEEGGISFIQGKLGISDDTMSIKAINCARVLTDFKDMLFEYVDYAHILDTTVVQEFKICASTSVGYPYKSKIDFINKLNAQFKGKIHLIFSSSLTKTCDVLVWAGELGKAKTTKVKTAEAWIAQGHPIKIMSGQELVRSLTALYCGLSIESL